jgi:hypothetical protein
MPRKRKTPQQKKTASYEKDRRNMYGENSKASRKAIPRHKAAENRSLRRIARQAVTQAAAQSDPDVVDAAEARLKRNRRGGWRKSPDRPLKVALARKIYERKRRAGAKAKRRARAG